MVWMRKRDRPKKLGFTRLLPHADRLRPIWDELASLAEREDRRLEVVLDCVGAYVLIGNPDNGIEVTRVCPTKGAARVSLCDKTRGELREAYSRHSSAVRHVLHMDFRPVLMSASTRLSAAIEEICSESSD
jgi:hypothetical protein